MFNHGSEHTQETGIKEKNNLLIALTPGNFTQAKQHLDYLFHSLNLSYTLKEKSHSYLIEGRSGEISLNGKEIGYIGEAHPSALKSWNLKMPLAIIELELDEIYKRIEKSNSLP